jgi:hypothetical protein
MHQTHQMQQMQQMRRRRCYDARMKRRSLLTVACANAFALTAGPSWADQPKVQSLDEALAWLDRLEKSRTAKTIGEWPMVAVLEHLSQSIEMSMDGFPELKSAVFQRTAGGAAFAFFNWHGAMNHKLSEPIPGAPALTREGNWRKSPARLRAAILRFEKHQGALMPHFAYGKLNKAEFARAHVLHIANHQDEIIVL